MSDENPKQCPVCEGPMENWESVMPDLWRPIETRPDEGEFLAWDPVSRKYDVCCAAIEDEYGYLDVGPSGKPFTTRRGKISTKKSCSAVQSDGEYGPSYGDFQGYRATHWQPLPPPPEETK